jgi:uncharacterized protein (DUF1501 family)
MELEYPEIMRRLSVPSRTLPGINDGTVERHGISRRRFLQAGALGAGAAAMTPYLSQLEAFAAPAIGPNDGVLVIITMGGGNDGLSTLAPVNDATYQAIRSSLKISPAQGLSVGSGLALHPNLKKLKARYDAGQVAIVRGVGFVPPDLSHFTSMASWMRGWGGAGSPPSGWIGRYMDGLPNAASESLYAATIGTSVPPHLVGAVSRASGLPESIGDAFGPDPSNKSSVREFNAFAAYASTLTGTGPWGDALAHANANAIDLSSKVRPVYGDGLPDSGLSRDLMLCARLINANFGIRVLNVEFDNFDNHSNEKATHDGLMQDFDDAIAAFYAALNPLYGSRVALMTFSEFGRRPEENDSGGTDHGTAGVHFVIGNTVKGGLYGAQPSMTALDQNDNLVISVDIRSVYASILDSWLKADSTQILGRTYENLGLFRSGPTANGVAASRARRRPHIRVTAPTRP